MDELMTAELRRLAEAAASREPAADGGSVRAAGAPLYENRNPRLNIDFAVERLTLAGAQTLDPRIVRIPPGRNNERHRHAHESLFVILDGRGELQIGETRVPVARGDVAFVPRWLFHQTHNTGDAELVLLAVTDFGFTSAVLGDYDARTRQKER
jgi:gentisate 1,2-dioxygenase